MGGKRKEIKRGGPLLINSYLLHCRHWAVLSGSYAGHKLKCTHSEEVEGVEGVRMRRSVVNDSEAKRWDWLQSDWALPTDWRRNMMCVYWQANGPVAGWKCQCAGFTVGHTENSIRSCPFRIPSGSKRLLGLFSSSVSSCSFTNGHQMIFLAIRGQNSITCQKPHTSDMLWRNGSIWSKATFEFIRSCVSSYLTSGSQITFFFALVWSSPTPVQNIWLFSWGMLR